MNGVLKSPGLIDYGLLVVLAAIWGGSFVLIKLTVEDFPAAMMTLLRLFFGALLLTLIARFFGERLRFNRKTVRLLVLGGLFGNALPFTLIAWGEQVVDAGLASILMGIMPLATLVLAHYFAGNEPLSRWKIMGVCIGIAGLGVLVGPAVLLDFGKDGVRQLAILTAAICYGINAIITKKLLDQPRKAAGAGMLFSGVLWLIPVVVLLDADATITPQFTSVLAIMLLATFPTALAALFIFAIIDRQGAGFFGQINFLVPVTGVLWAFVLLGEEPEIRSIIALIIILFGIGIARLGGSMPLEVKK